MAGNLFNFPRAIAFDVGVVQPGAKITFTATGTTDPQNTYTNIGLTVASSNPVVADAEGLFAPIYLDPTLPDYRVKYTDSADVLIYQEDDVPASQSGESLTLTGTAPFIDLIETDAAANNTSWRIQVNSEQLTLQLANDALAAFTDILTIDRTANTVDIIDLLPTTLNHNALNLGVSTGTFVATWLGFTTSPTTTWNYTKVGSQVTLHSDATLSATSNQTGLLSGATDVPAALRPTETTANALFIVTDNGTTQTGIVRVGSGGLISFSADVQSSSFTGSGTKGHAGGLCFTYLID